MSDEQDNGKPTGPVSENINIQVGVHPEKALVVLSFGVALSWLNLDPRFARHIAVGLINAADLAENPPKEESMIKLPPSGRS